MSTRRVDPAAWVALVILGGVWAWWGSKEGAYFGTVFYPGALILVLGALLLLFGAPWRVNLRLSRGAAVGLVALTALAAWHAISASWSPAPDIAAADAQRVLSYALACALGLWVATMLGRRTQLALAPVVFAAAIAGAVTVIAMLTGDTPDDYLVDDGTLEFPLGYRNANAAFFLIAVWPAVGLAGDRALDWRLRALATGTATICIDLAIMSQSRGSMIAAPIAVIVFLALSPTRARSLVWLLLAVLPALAIVPATVDLYAAGEDATVTDALGELRGTGRAALLTVAIAVLLASLWAWLEPRATTFASRARVNWNTVVAALGVAVLLTGAGAFVAAVGDPAEWVDERFQELGAGNPEREGQATRFSFDAGSRRTDLWRVALDDAAEEPLRGDGAGGFQYSYTRNRDVAEQYARDAHSVELEILSELGYPGLILFVAAIGGLVVAAVRSLRSGPPAAALCAPALAAAAYWLAHASVDWFWTYPVVTAPALYLLGAACGPSAMTEPRPLRGATRGVLAVAAVVFAVSLIPPFLSERYVDQAYSTWRSDLGQAYQDLDRAAQLNPLSDQPLLAEGGIARAAGDRERAIDAFDRAVQERPEEWAGPYFLALLHRRDDPDLAARQVRTARELNPLEPLLESLESELRSNASRGG